LPSFFAPPLAWSPDGELLAIGRRDLRVRVVRFPGKQTFDIAIKDYPNCVAWRPDSQLLAILGRDLGQLSLWNRAGVLHKEMSTDVQEGSIAWGGPASQLVCGTPKECLVWDRDGKALPPLPHDEQKPLWQLAWAPNGTALV